MSKEKVFIVLTHKHILKNSRTAQWEVSESVEFVNQLRKRHLTTASAVGDYLNRSMMMGKKVGMEDYSKFEEYVRSKYAKQMNELDSLYSNDRVPAPETEAASADVVTDNFGNVRPKTVFDVA